MAWSSNLSRALIQTDLTNTHSRSPRRARVVTRPKVQKHLGQDRHLLESYEKGQDHDGLACDRGGCVGHLDVQFALDSNARRILTNDASAWTRAEGALPSMMLPHLKGTGDHFRASQRPECLVDHRPRDHFRVKEEASQERRAEPAPDRNSHRGHQCPLQRQQAKSVQTLCTQPCAFGDSSMSCGAFESSQVQDPGHSYGGPRLESYSSQFACDGQPRSARGIATPQLNRPTLREGVCPASASDPQQLSDNSCIEGFGAFQALEYPFGVSACQNEGMLLVPRTSAHFLVAFSRQIGEENRLMQQRWGASPNIEEQAAVMFLSRICQRVERMCVLKTLASERPLMERTGMDVLARLHDECERSQRHIERLLVRRAELIERARCAHEETRRDCDTLWKGQSDELLRCFEGEKESDASRLLNEDVQRLVGLTYWIQHSKAMQSELGEELENRSRILTRTALRGHQGGVLPPRQALLSLA